GVEPTAFRRAKQSQATHAAFVAQRHQVLDLLLHNRRHRSLFSYHTSVRGTYIVLPRVRLARACGLEGLIKILRRGEINPALLDQLGARLVPESVPHHVADLLLGKRLCRANALRCSADLEVSTCRPEGRRYNFLLRPHGQRQNHCDDEHEDGYNRSTPHGHLPKGGITTRMCRHSTTGSSRILIPALAGWRRAQLC